jgi:aspartyl-tRNA synthetase
MEASIREQLVSDNFIQIYSPKFMSTPSESGAELFSVPYFDTTAYLAQSPQFYKQMAMASGLEKVFEWGTVFRADPSFTSRHATEFTGFDLEMSYIESVDDVMAKHAELMAGMIKKVKEAHGDAIKKDYDRELVVPELPFPVVTFTEAKEILKGLKVPNTKQSDLSPEEEKAISQYFLEKTGNEFLFVKDYPFAGRAFYSMRYDDNDLCKSFDLLWNGLEVTSGAQREHRYEEIKKNLEMKKVSMEHMQTYLDFFKFGCPPHGGFGNGPARLLMKLLGISNIREVTYVYRGINRLDP